jgi:autotransporter-associated beta strand protein
VTVRTGNLYVQHDVWGRDSTGVIEGGTLLTDGDMHKINGGTLILNNVNTYTGKTIIDDGKLIVNGSIAGDAEVTDNATLGGHGLIGGSVTVDDGGILSPGNSPGLLTINGDLTLSGLSTLDIELGGTDAGLFDQLYVGGLFNADGMLCLLILDGYTPSAGDNFLIFTNGGFDHGDFTSLTTNLSDGLSWDLSQLASTGRITVVPEPSTCALAIVALLGLIVLRRRRAKGSVLPY